MLGTGQDRSVQGVEPYRTQHMNIKKSYINATSTRAFECQNEYGDESLLNPLNRGVNGY